MIKQIVSLTKIFDMNRFLLLIFCFFAINFSAFSQENTTKYINRKAIGGMTAFGLTYYSLPENVTYRPILLQAFWHKPLYQTKNFFNVSLDILPQINFTFLNGNPEFEFGANLYVDFGFQLSKNSILSANIGSGPHFITVETTKQSNGFLFSDNFLLEFKHKISENCEFGIFSGYRHMSNASIKQPNNGIDNILFGFLVAKLL